MYVSYTRTYVGRNGFFKQEFRTGRFCKQKKKKKNALNRCLYMCMMSRNTTRGIAWQLRRCIEHTAVIRAARYRKTLIFFRSNATR